MKGKALTQLVDEQMLHDLLRCEMRFQELSPKLSGGNALVHHTSAVEVQRCLLGRHRAHIRIVVLKQPHRGQQQKLVGRCILKLNK